MLDRVFSFRQMRHIWLLMFALLLVEPAQAHRPNETYIYMQVSDTSISGRFESRVSDLDRMFQLDKNGDNNVSEGEFDAGFGRITADLQPSLTFVIDGQRLPIKFTGYSMFGEGPDRYARPKFDIEYSGEIPDKIRAQYNGAIARQLPGHTVMLLIENNSKTGLTDNEAHVSLIFGTENSEQELSFEAQSGFETLVLFIEHGFYHILIGFDHIAFLMALLLPAVLVARNGKWEPVDSLRAGLWNILKIVTVFTIAHSITLSLAALGIVQLPERPVEILIALSIVAAAVINLTVVGKNWTLLAMFSLGLLHGLGFASVMLPLGVAKPTLLQSLLGFNLGVELGQMAIVAVVFPCLMLLSRWRHYVRVVLHGGSIGLILVAIYWFGERAIIFAGKMIA